MSHPLRARHLDKTKPLQVLLEGKLFSRANESSLDASGTDFNEYKVMSQIASTLSTGMEKEEEEELHIKIIMQEKQAHAEQELKTIIPVPESLPDAANYTTNYPVSYIGKQKDHINPMLLQLNKVDYDCDTEDELWLAGFNNSMAVATPEAMEDNLLKDQRQYPHILTEEELERGMDIFEKLCPYGVNRNIRLDQIPILTMVHAKDIFNYWLRKKAKLTPIDRSIYPEVLSDRRVDVVDVEKDPYVAFRKRNKKIQTRKNRKTSEKSHNHMLTLCREMMQLQDILVLIKKKEALKREVLLIEKQSFMARLDTDDWHERHIIKLANSQASSATLMCKLSNSTNIDYSSNSMQPSLGSDSNGFNLEGQSTAIDNHRLFMNDSIVGNDQMNNNSFALSSSNTSPDFSQWFTTQMGHTVPRVPLENPFPFKRKKGIVYCTGKGLGKPQIEHQANPYFAMLDVAPIVKPHKDIKYGRKRIGRHGRVIIDPHPIIISSTTEVLQAPNSISNVNTNNPVALRLASFVDS